MREAVTILLLASSAFFFLAGTLGVLRFPDACSRLHAVTKADNLGLGLLCAALSLQSGSIAVAAKLALVWVFALIASATSSQLIAETTEWHGATRKQRSERDA
jgi:multicomponent Na+:H+ antiporter subunit G